MSHEILITDGARFVLAMATAFADRWNRVTVNELDVFWAIAHKTDDIGPIVFASFGVRLLDLADRIQSRYLSKVVENKVIQDETVYCSTLTDIVQKASQEAASIGDKFVDVLHLFLAVISIESPDVVSLIGYVGITSAMIRKEVFRCICQKDTR